MPEEMKEKFLSQFPKRLTFYTRITTDEQGLIYVYIPYIRDLGKQKIDIFSSEGKYLYHSVIELPSGYQKIRPFVFKRDTLYALIKTKDKRNLLIKFRIKKPIFQKKTEE